MELKNILAKNLLELRKSKSLTQLELADKLNYSDKSVSKWEHGDAMPDVEVLAKIAKFYNVTVDYLISEHNQNDQDITLLDEKSQRRLRGKKLIITLLSISALWTITTIIYVQTLIWSKLNLWMLFIWSVPISFVLLLIFNAIWGRHRFSVFLSSFLVWTIIASLYLQFLQYNIWVLFFIGIPIQISLILSLKLRN